MKGIAMKFPLSMILGIFLTVAAAPAFATYSFVPDHQTEATCRKLKLVGAFQLKHQSSNDWEMVFKTGATEYMVRKSNSYFEYTFGCAYGCTGYSKVWLNLKTKQFYDWNSINRNPPELCQGSVVTATTDPDSL
jgi:hypothetical protein